MDGLHDLFKLLLELSHVVVENNVLLLELLLPCLALLLQALIILFPRLKLQDLQHLVRLFVKNHQRFLFLLRVPTLARVLHVACAEHFGHDGLLIHLSFNGGHEAVEPRLLASDAHGLYAFSERVNVQVFLEERAARNPIERWIWPVPEASLDGGAPNVAALAIRPTREQEAVESFFRFGARSLRRGIVVTIIVVPTVIASATLFVVVDVVDVVVLLVFATAPALVVVVLLRLLGPLRVCNLLVDPCHSALHTPEILDRGGHLVLGSVTVRPEEFPQVLILLRWVLEYNAYAAVSRVLLDALLENLVNFLPSEFLPLSIHLEDDVAWRDAEIKGMAVLNDLLHYDLGELLKLAVLIDVRLPVLVGVMRLPFELQIVGQCFLVLVFDEPNSALFFNSVPDSHDIHFSNSF
mmetsp:Transcript_35828/g.98729  ORF Transcript_35828/g.98729 Transcript_35828/m.98729 type:complete len:409 (-) Transcript_35828:4036-5262(-)